MILVGFGLKFCDERAAEWIGTSNLPPRLRWDEIDFMAFTMVD
jgi:hypothetical protein